MNTQLKIKTRQLLFSPGLVGIVVVLAMLAFSGPSIQAQTATGTATADTTAPAPVDSSITVPSKGSVSDPNGSFTVTGNVNISGKMVVDTTTSTTAIKLVLLDFDFSGLQGTTSAKKVFVTGENHATEIRLLQASDTIIVPVPYYDSTKDVMSARTMLATITVNFDTSTGKLTGATVSVGNNVVTSTAVGTTAATATPQ